MEDYISKSSIDQLTRVIVDKHFSDEKEVYEILGEDEIDKCLTGGDLLKSNDIRGTQEFGEGVVEVLKFISVIAGTVKSIVDLMKAYKSKRDKMTKDVIIKKWQNELIKAGISNEKAELIAKEFSEEVDKMIR